MEQQFPLTYSLSKTGLPLIDVKSFDIDICLLLDTSSNINIIDERIYEYLKDKLPETEEHKNIGALYGMGEGVLINLPFTFESQEYNELFVTSVVLPSAIERVYNEAGIRVHGILGNLFFLKHGWILDFKKMEVYK